MIHLSSIWLFNGCDKDSRDENQSGTPEGLKECSEDGDLCMGGHSRNCEYTER